MTDANDTPAQPPVAPAQNTQPRRPGRSRWRLPLMLLGPVIVIAVGSYIYLHGGRYESTDDAYIQAARVAVSANVSGRVQQLLVRDNQVVHQGDVLFRLDDAPFRIAVEESAAQLAAARLQIESTKASYRQRQSQVQAAKDTLAFQETEYARQQRLVAAGISSQSQLDRALHARDDARAQLAGADQQLNAVAAALGGNPNIAPERHPSVQQAQAQLDRARLNLSYTVVRAPSDGVVTKVEQLQVGTYVNASAPLFALVNVHDLWIEANFKEDQLSYMRPGQTASVEVDAYPNRRFDARVASVSPGTGSQFSVLPPENATGNWVKVVQRLPVRIELTVIDPAYPLQSGLSANVTVDTQHTRGLFPFARTAHASAPPP
ncbi:MAG TPA: HlyD family secretion protein [Casimicrobiaceae bacterium]|nr:HlyD family secretion protein [Casimicrobiaceae bacterium]